jgi:preprotein translocase subunit YajC
MFLPVSQLHAMSPVPGPAEGPGALASFLPFAVIIVLFYFLLIRPQQKQQKERTNLLKNLKGGEDVVTVGGVYAKVVKVNEDDTMILKISDNTNIKVTRQAVERLQK